MGLKMPKSGSDTLVLLASYNGAEHLVVQLESLQQQTHKVDVWVSDDGSSDETLSIARSFDNVTVVRENADSKPLGHNGNFGYLAERAKDTHYDYFYFCDQDDRWVTTKVAQLNAELSCLESEHGRCTPALVHSDLTVVDKEGRVIAPSFIEYQGLPNPAKHQLPLFLYQNVVTGCAAGFNRALLKTATPLPKSAVVHDFWFALVAYCCGRIHYVPSCLVNYRQHGKNSIGALSAKEQKSLLKPHYYRALINFPAHITACIKQAEEVKRRYAEEMQGEHLWLVSMFTKLKTMPLRQRAAAIDTLFPQYRGWRQQLFLHWSIMRA